MRTSLPLFIAALMTALAAQAGDIYRWKDANGVTQYSDRPVPGAERIRAGSREAAQVRSAAPASSPAAGPGTETPAKGTVERMRDDVAADKAAKCKDAQTNYEQTITARRLFRQGPKGEQIFLSDEEIEAARVTARANMEYYCGK